MPKRLQLSRRKGYRKPAGAVVVSRPGPWGNPFKIGDPHPVHGRPMIASEASEAFRKWLETTPEGRAMAQRIRRELHGRDFACWCPLPAAGQKDTCHGAVILEVAAAALPWSMTFEGTRDESSKPVLKLTAMIDAQGRTTAFTLETIDGSDSLASATAAYRIGQKTEFAK